MRAQTAIALFVGLALWATSPASVLAQSAINDFTKGPMGTVTLRVGVTDYGRDGTGRNGDPRPPNVVTKGGGRL